MSTRYTLSFLQLAPWNLEDLFKGICNIILRVPCPMVVYLAATSTTSSYADENGKQVRGTTRTRGYASHGIRYYSYYPLDFEGREDVAKMLFN